MTLPLKQFITLVSPAQVIAIAKEEPREENGSEILYKGVAAKLRDNPELLDREVKLIQAMPALTGARLPAENKTLFWIWIY